MDVNRKKIETVFAHFVFIFVITLGVGFIVYRVLHDLDIIFKRDIVPLLIVGSLYVMTAIGIKYRGTAIGDGTARNVKSKKNGP